MEHVTKLSTTVSVYKAICMCHSQCCTMDEIKVTLKWTSDVIWLDTTANQCEGVRRRVLNIETATEISLVVWTYMKDHCTTLQTVHAWSLMLP